MMLMFPAVDVTELEDMRIPCKGYWSVNKSALKAMFGGDIETVVIVSLQANSWRVT